MQHRLHLPAPAILLVDGDGLFVELVVREMARLDGARAPADRVELITRPTVSGALALFQHREVAAVVVGLTVGGADGLQFVRLLRERFPGVPVVVYVNTSAGVKAESDICCTSSNALQVVESLGSDRVIFLPDQYLAKYVASQTKVKIIAWTGACEVHERFTGDELRLYRETDPNLKIIAHPECPQNILAEADFIGGTEKMRKYVMSIEEPTKFLVATEANMIHPLRAAAPQHEYIPVPGIMTDTGQTCACNRCPHMARNSLQKVRDCLKYGRPEITWQPYFDRAKAVLERSLLESPPASKPVAGD